MKLDLSTAEAKESNIGEHGEDGSLAAGASTKEIKLLLDVNKIVKVQIIPNSVVEQIQNGLISKDKVISEAVNHDGASSFKSS